MAVLRRLVQNRPSNDRGVTMNKNALRVLCVVGLLSLGSAAPAMAAHPACDRTCLEGFVEK